MSTVFELLIATEDQQLAQSAAHAVFKKVDGLEELFSRYLDASEVALISRLKPGETFRVAPELMEMLLTATRVCAATQGAFDVTVGPVMDALREVKHRWRALTPQERESALAACGMRRLVIDTTGPFARMLSNRSVAQLLPLMTGQVVGEKTFCTVMSQTGRSACLISGWIRRAY